MAVGRDADGSQVRKTCSQKREVGATVIEATSGQDALTSIAGIMPDVLVLDGPISRVAERRLHATRGFYWFCFRSHL
jgi:hypothetical protein